MIAEPDNVLAKTDLVKIITSYLPLVEGRRQLKGKCPFHADTSTSLMVSPQKNIFKCFGCGIDGGPVEFVMMYENKSRAEAIQYLADSMAKLS
jgi:DNA primase